MPTQPLTDAELVILSLILEQPQHGYQIEQQITMRNMRTWTDLSTSSIYYIIGKLNEKGFIEQLPEDPKTQGERPKKGLSSDRKRPFCMERSHNGCLNQPKDHLHQLFNGIA